MQRASFDEASTAYPVAVSQDLMASPPAIYPGQLLGDRYNVGERIGGGGMADVFRGRDPYLHRDVAIKVIKHGMASGEMCARMLQEGRATAAIDHPHLLRVLDFGRVGATVYLVTDLLRGCSLAQHLRSRPDARLGWRDAIELLLPALDALAKIHDHGLVHRDLKPDNLFVHHRDGREALIVLDLGIAKVSPALRSAGALQTTESGRVLGTPAYLAPEAIAGQADARSDQFSFAASLWQALFGTFPYDEHAFDSLSRATLRDPPAREDLNPQLIAALRRALAPSPAARFPDMAALLGALRELPQVQVDHRPTTIARPPVPASRSAPYLLTAFALATSGAAYGFWPTDESPEDAATPIAPGQPVLALPGPTCELDEIVGDWHYHTSVEWSEFIDLIGVSGQYKVGFTTQDNCRYDTLVTKLGDSGKPYTESRRDRVSAQDRYEMALDLDASHLPTLGALRQIAMDNADYDKAARYIDQEQSYTPAPRQRARLLAR